MNKIAIIGAGYWGKNLIRNFFELGVLAGVCDLNTELYGELEKKYSGVIFYKRIEDLFLDNRINAVVIAAPASLHGSLANKALMAGKNVFVEKPLCLNIEEGRELKNLADQRGLVLMVGHLLLYHPAVKLLFHIVKNNQLGNLRYIYSNRLSLGKIRREENALWSFAPHDISMILQLTGQMPQRVTANGANYLTDGVADTTLSHLNFDNNLQAHIYVSWLHPFKEQKLVVVGEDAMAVFDDTKVLQEKLSIYKHKVGWDGKIPVISKAGPEYLNYKDEEPLKNECRAFLNAIDGLSQPLSDASEGIRVLQVLEACQRSILEGRYIDMDLG